MSKNITMMVLGTGYDKSTVIKVSNGDNLAIADLNEKETLSEFEDVLSEYGFTITKK